MNALLQKLFAKRGITDVSELQPEEKKVFEDWKKVLSKEELTMRDVKEFCDSQLRIIEMKWADLTLDQVKKAELIPYHTVYKTLLVIIDSPKVAREALERQLIELTK